MIPTDADTAGELRSGQKALRLGRSCQAPGAPRGPAEWDPCHSSSPSSSPSSDEDEHPAPTPGAAALSPFHSPCPGGEAPAPPDAEERKGSDMCNPLSGGDGARGWWWWGGHRFSPSLLKPPLASPTPSTPFLCCHAPPQSSENPSARC